MVTFSQQAISDLDDIYEFHRLRNPRYADQLNDHLRQAARSLAQNPERGTALSRRPPFRRLIEKDHMIVYAVTEAEVTIVRVLYGARDIENLLSETPWPA